MLNPTFRLAVLSALLLAASTIALAEDHDRFQSSSDIRVEKGDRPRDVTCLNCSIFVLGEVTGDATSINGSVILENGGVVHGDTTAVLGSVKLAADSSVDRDVTAVGGSIHRDSRASVKGDVTSVGGGGWVVLVVALPLAFLGGMLALVVWLILWVVRRNRQSVPVAVYAQTSTRS